MRRVSGAAVFIRVDRDGRRANTDHHLPRRVGCRARQRHAVPGQDKRHDQQTGNPVFEQSTYHDAIVHQRSASFQRKRKAPAAIDRGKIQT